MTATHCSVCGTRVLTQTQTGLCWRHRRPRTGGMRRGGHGRKDPVTPATAAAVHARDEGCIGPRVGIPGTCSGPLELDHVHTGGLSLRGPSTSANLVVLCRMHHRYKTEHARVVRAMIDAYLAMQERRAGARAER